MKEVYAILDRHTRYVATKEFFRTKTIEGSSVQEHGVKMLSLVEKLEDLKVGLDNDTYIDAKGKRAGRWKRKKGKAKGKVVIAKNDDKSAPVAPLGMGNGRERWVLSSSRGQMIFALIAVRKGIGRGIVPNSLPSKVCLLFEVNMGTNSAS
ncbi:UNVERIFIED_CONTAM: hypothetical protein Sangu_1712900 [Sesamum angustifolium]|uniref:Uncharacterized protein n=1 Tax=Sesamum angustifolium TaxID=2727405 RepID=A0AAW2MLK9_9LAMI